MAWFLNLKVLLLFFLINCLKYNNKKLAAISNLWLLRKISNLWVLGLEDQALCCSNVKVVDQLSVRLNSLFILLDYFRKYFYFSFKTTTFLLLLKYFFWTVLRTLLQVVFSSVTKLLLDYNFRILFTPLQVNEHKKLTKFFFLANSSTSDNVYMRNNTRKYCSLTMQ